MRVGLADAHDSPLESAQYFPPTHDVRVDRSPARRLVRDEVVVELLHLIDHADGWNLDSRIKSISTALGTPALEATVGPLSGGEKRRVALCQLLLMNPDLLLLDEPTNHLDAETVGWLEQHLQKYEGTIIAVTHDEDLAAKCERIIEMKDGRIMVNGELIIEEIKKFSSSIINLLFTID